MFYLSFVVDQIAPTEIFVYINKQYCTRSSLFSFCWTFSFFSFFFVLCFLWVQYFISLFKLVIIIIMIKIAINITRIIENFYQYFSVLLSFTPKNKPTNINVETLLFNICCRCSCIRYQLVQNSLEFETLIFLFRN
jgi:hypothetical protein